MRNTRLMNLSKIQEIIHEEDKKLYPDKHFLTKDFYSMEDTFGMCYLCSEHYEWHKQLEYDVRIDGFYKNNLGD